jgi:DNA-binding MarR family transcriptional regulator
MNDTTLRDEVLAELLEHQPAKGLRYMRKLPGGALSLVHLQVLMALENDGSLPMGRLAETMDVSQASATGIVDRMEQRGLVERLRDEQDRRVVRVALTSLGRETVAGFATERRDHLQQILGALTEEELAGFLAGLRGMRRGREQLHARLAAEHEAAHPGVRFHDDVPPPQSPTPAAEAPR